MTRMREMGGVSSHECSEIACHDKIYYFFLPLNEREREAFLQEAIVMHVRGVYQDIIPPLL